MKECEILTLLEMLQESRSCDVIKFYRHEHCRIGRRLCVAGREAFHRHRVDQTRREHFAHAQYRLVLHPTAKDLGEINESV